MNIFVFNHVGQSVRAQREHVALVNGDFLDLHIDVRLDALAGLSRLVARLSGVAVSPLAPIVGGYVFAHRSPSHLKVPAEFEAIQASLTMLQCTRCHTEAVLSRLVLQTPARQVATIRRMQRMPESGIRPDQVPQIIEAFRALSGQK